MRVLLVTFPWKTHFFSLVPLAWALQTAGHEVSVASEPNLIDTITGAGLTAVGVGSGEPVEERVRRAWRDGAMPTPQDAPPLGEPAPLFDVRQNRERLSWAQLVRLYDTLMVPRAQLSNDSMVDDLVAFCKSWRPDLVIWNSATFAGSVAAAAVGAAHARFPYCIDLFFRMRDDYLYAKQQRPPEERVDGLQDWFTRWANKYGCEFSEELVHGHFTIDQMLPSFRPDSGLHYLPMRYVPYNGPAVIPKWLNGSAPRAPRVVMTLGLSSRDMPELQVVSVDRLQDILRSVADLDIELVVTLPRAVRERLTHIPGNTRVVEFVPLPAILPSCSAVINHGGTGSFNTSLLNGVPQLLISQALDAPLKSIFLDRAGAGLTVPPDEVTGERVREGLVRLLSDPSFRAGAARLRREAVALPTPNDLVPELAELTTRYRAEPSHGR